MVRLLSRDENTVIDEEFFEKRVRDAWEYRKKVTEYFKLSRDLRRGRFSAGFYCGQVF